MLMIQASLVINMAYFLLHVFAFVLMTSFPLGCLYSSLNMLEIYIRHISPM